MKRELLIYLFFAAIIAVSLFPIFFGGRIFVNTDTAISYYPGFDFYSRALKGGESILWNPLLFSGFPTYVSQSAGLLDPLNLIIFRFLPSINGYHLRLFVDLFLVLLFSYLAGKAYGLSRLSASLVGMSYLLAFNWGYLSNLVIANSLFLLPFLFFIWAKILAGERKKWFWAIVGGVGTGWVFISGYTQVNIYALFLFGLFAFLHFFFVQPADKNIKNLFSTIVSLLAIMFVGFLTALPYILPALNFIPLSSRSSGLDFSLTTFKAINPGDFSLFLFPDYLYFPYLSGGRRPLYVGAIWFFLSLAALFIGWRHLRKKIQEPKETAGMIIVLGLLFLFTLIAAIRFSPLFYLVQKLPVFEYFRFPYRWMYLGIWFLAFLGGYGFDLFKEYVVSRGMRRLFTALGSMVLGIAVGVSMLNFLGEVFWNWAGDLLHGIFSKILYGNFGFTKDLLHYRDAIGRGIEAWQRSVDFTDISFLVPYASLMAALGLGMAFLWQKIGWERFRIYVFILSCLTFLGVFMVQWPNTISSEVTTSHNLLVERFIPKEDQALFRTYPFLLQSGFAKRVVPTYILSREDILALTEFQHASGWPNVNFYSGMASVDGYDLFTSRDMLAALALLGSTHGGADVNGGVSDSERVSRLVSHLELLGMMGGKYIISGVRLNHKNLRFLGEYPASRYQIPLYIYENTKALPRFYFASFPIAAPGKSITALLEEGSKDFRTYTYVDCEDCIDDSSQDGEGQIEIAELKNGLLRLHINLVSTRWLVISESFLPGWRAEIDGSEATIVRANGLFMAVMVPTGSHFVSLRYEGILGETRIWDKMKDLFY